MKFVKIITGFAIFFAIVAVAFINVSVAQNGETTTTTTTTETTITTQPPTCDLTATDISFGNLLPGETSVSDATSTLTSTGELTITTVGISGTDWEATSGFLVSQTHFSINSGDPYETMTALSSEPQPLSLMILPPTVYFKLQIPNNQPAGNYQQTITFDFTCDGMIQ